MGFALADGAGSSSSDSSGSAAGVLETSRSLQPPLPCVSSAWREAIRRAPPPGTIGCGLSIWPQVFAFAVRKACASAAPASRSTIANISFRSASRKPKMRIGPRDGGHTMVLPFSRTDCRNGSLQLVTKKRKSGNWSCPSTVSSRVTSVGGGGEMSALTEKDNVSTAAMSLPFMGEKIDHERSRLAVRRETSPSLEFHFLSGGTRSTPAYAG